MLKAEVMRRRILIIAFHYPPALVSSGIQRTLKFSGYLREFGWEPIVLTINPRAYEQISNDQLKDIPEDLIVERAFGLDTSRHLAVCGRYARMMAQPDRWVSWAPAGLWRGMALIRKYKPVAIMSTFPIATAHLIGLGLQRMSGLPWVADFRDSMTEPGYPRDPMTWRVHRRLEQASVRHCTRAIFTTEPTRQMYVERYPEFPRERWAVIENGYDEENFVQAESTCSKAPFGCRGQLTLIHSGVLYPKERDPRPFFAALHQLKASGEIGPHNLQIFLRATGSDELYQPMLAQADLTDIVKLLPTVSYREALQEMLRADGLLLFQGSICNHQLPAKLYEYFRAGRPIFGLVDANGITAAGLRAAGSLNIVDIANSESIVRGLREYLSAMRGGTLSGVPPEIASRHSRRGRTCELASLLNTIVR